MVNKINDRPTNLDRIYPNDKLTAEWDLLMEIWQSLEVHAKEEQPAFTTNHKKPEGETVGKATGDPQGHPPPNTPKCCISRSTGPKCTLKGLKMILLV